MRKKDKLRLIEDLNKRILNETHVIGSFLFTINLFLSRSQT